MKIELNNKTNILVKEAIYIETKTINKLKVTDDGKSVVASIMIGDKLGPIKILTLWNETSTPSYTAIGNWIDSDVDTRIIQLITS